jgi:hypothetical protein
LWCALASVVACAHGGPAQEQSRHAEAETALTQCMAIVRAALTGRETDEGIVVLLLLADTVAAQVCALLLACRV